MDLIPVSITALVIAVLVLTQIARKDFDPFAPIWLFLAGFAQIYVVQAISYRDYGVRTRGEEIVTAGNVRALWAMLLFIAVYYSGVGKKIAARMPQAPTQWSTGLVTIASPLLIVWGLLCSVLAFRMGALGGEENIFIQFPMMLLVGGVLLLVTGRQPNKPQPVYTIAGLTVCVGYCLIWMFNAKRSHAIFAILAGVSAFYIPRLRRPSLPMMGATGLACVLAVSIAIGWRGTNRYNQDVNGFLQYLGDFKADSILVNLNLKERSEVDPDFGEQPSKETEEIGGFWLMLDTVPEKSPYDFGASYMRIVSTFIPRVIWPSKPLYGRAEWLSAWMAGSEFPRDETFTGPAIGLLGATQLNGGALATAIVVALLALITRTCYDYFRFNAATPWAQAWWSLTYYNAWLMNANDDPFVWFYYVYGYTSFPVMIGFWLFNKFSAPQAIG